MKHCYKIKPLVLIFTAILFLVQFGVAIQDGNAQSQDQAYAEYIQARAAFIQEHANLSKAIDLNIKNKTRLQAVQEIARKAGFKISYDTELPQLNEKINLKMEQTSAEEALWAVLNGAGLRFAVSPNRQLVLVPRKEESVEVSELQQTVTGVVVDAQTREVLPGVNIMLKGTLSGTSTDSNGNYELIVPSLQDTLVFSYIGYQIKEEPVNGRTEVDVAMEWETVTGDELIVIGYGTQRKSDLTGSVSSISERDFHPGMNNSVGELLQGKVAGVEISQTSGEPGSGLAIRIRGVGSINAGTSPLYVLDGVPLDGRPSINTNDIGSIEILKDASATAIYGSRGANGVVLVTTKTGPNDDMQISYNFQAGRQSVANKLDVLSTDEYINQINSLSADAGNAPVFSDEDRRSIGAGTDWQDQIFKTALMTENNLSIAGGQNETNYLVSLSRYRQDGIVKNSGIEDYTIRTRINTTVYDKLDTGITLLTSIRNNERNPETLALNEQGGPIYTSLLYDPTSPVRNEDGGFYRSPNLTINNPVSLVEGIDNKSRSKRFFVNAYGQYNFTDHLNMRLNIGYDNSSSKMEDFNSTQTILGAANNGIASINTYDNENFLAELTAEYTRDLNENNHIRILGGTTYQSFISESFTGGISGFPKNSIKTYNLGLGNINTVDIGSNRSGNKLVSYLGRINYRLLNKYLFTTSIRADGSSRFGENNKYGIFPSFAFAWNLDQEDFITGYFDELKLRTSWGVTGNQEIGNYNTQRSFTSGREVVLGGNRVGSLNPSRIANPDLKWERTEQYNVGIDYGILEGRISGTIDYFVKNTTNMLLQEPLPPSTGFTSWLVNLEDVQLQNKGIEFMLNTVNISSLDFSWSSTFIFSAVRTNVKNLGDVSRITLGGLQDVGNTSIIQEGESLASYFGYEITGIFQEGDDIANSPQPNAQPGHPIVLDVNGDNQITADDRKILGNPYPDFTFGFQNNISFSSFNFGVFIQAKQGVDLLNVNMIESMYPHNFRRNKLAETTLNRWTPENPNTKYPSGVNPSEYSGGKVNSLTIQDASFIRLKNVSVSYRIPQSIIRSATISLTGENLLTITNYQGYNPEANAFGGAISRVDFNAYPLTKNILLGINIEF